MDAITPHEINYYSSVLIYKKKKKKKTRIEKVKQGGNQISGHRSYHFFILFLYYIIITLPLCPYLPVSIGVVACESKSLEHTTNQPLLYLGTDCLCVWVNNVLTVIDEK